MKITIEPTDDVYLAEILVPAVEGHTMCRLWKGVTDDGVAVHAWILAVSPQTHDEGVALRFATELRQRDVRIRAEPEEPRHPAYGPGSITDAATYGNKGE